MWPFKNERRRAIEEFSRFVSPDVINDVLAHPEADYPPPQRVFIGYLMVQVRDDDLKTWQQITAHAIEVIQQNNGTMNGVTVSLLTACFWLAGDATAHCRGTVQQLSAEYGADLKIVYGSGEALIGSFGGPDYFAYGMMFSAFSIHLEKLCSLNYGEAAEMNL